MKGHIITSKNNVNILKYLRKQKNITQSQLSAITGIPMKSIGNYEQGFRCLSTANGLVLYKLSKALDCRMEDLIDETLVR